MIRAFDFTVQDILRQLCTEVSGDELEGYSLEFQRPMKTELVAYLSLVDKIPDGLF